MIENIPTYKVFDLLNDFNSIVENHSDKKISTEEARNQLAIVKSKANKIGLVLTDIDQILSTPIDNFSLVYFQFKELADQYADKLIKKEKVLSELGKLEKLAKELRVPFSGGLDLLEFLTSKNQIKVDDEEVWDDYPEAESSSEEYIEDEEYFDDE